MLTKEEKSALKNAIRATSDLLYELKSIKKSGKVSRVAMQNLYNWCGAAYADINELNEAKPIPPHPCL